MLVLQHRITYASSHRLCNILCSLFGLPQMILNLSRLTATIPCRLLPLLEFEGSGRFFATCSLIGLIVTTSSQTSVSEGCFALDQPTQSMLHVIAKMLDQLGWSPRRCVRSDRRLYGS